MTTPVQAEMQQRRGTAAQWTAANTVLLAGEIGVETDSRNFKIGDGVTAWNSLSYYTSPKTLQGQNLTAIGAGTEVTWTAPVALQVVALQAILTTSSVPAERTPFIVATVGGVGCVVSGTPRGQPPSTAVQYQWGKGYDVAGPMAAAVSCPLSGPLTLPAGATLTTYTVRGTGVGIGLDTADQWSFMTWLYVPL